MEIKLKFQTQKLFYKSTVEINSLAVLLLRLRVLLQGALTVRKIKGIL